MQHDSSEIAHAPGRFQPTVWETLVEVTTAWGSMPEILSGVGQGWEWQCCSQTRTIIFAASSVSGSDFNSSTAWKLGGGRKRTNNTLLRYKNKPKCLFCCNMFRIVHSVPHLKMANGYQGKETLYQMSILSHNGIWVGSYEGKIP